MKCDFEWEADLIFFKQLVESAGILAWITAEDGHCIYFSPAWYAFTGAIPGSRLGFDWLTHLHHDDAIRVRQTFFRANDLGAEYGIAYRMLTQSGDYQLVWGHGIPRKKSNGRFSGYLGTTQTMDQYTDQFAQVEAYAETSTVRPLSARETQVMQLVAQGLSNDRIAVALGIRCRTVEEHVRHSVEKLGALNRVHAVAKALRLQII